MRVGKCLNSTREISGAGGGRGKGGGIPSFGESEIAQAFLTDVKIGHNGATPPFFFFLLSSFSLFFFPSSGMSLESFH